MGAHRLPANQPEDRFYRGGAQIDDFRRVASDTSSTHQPEDWVASTTSVFGQEPVGLTFWPDGRPLRDSIDADPARWLSPAHIAAFGTDVKLLTKLLDAGQRLPVHAHPHVSFSSEHLGRTHGKAEAWYILRGGEVHLGLREDVDPTTLIDLVDAQDAGALLGLLNLVTVSAGDVIYVAPGVLHAIGQGVLILEVQEPEDLSILLEWEGFDLDGERDGHLGLGFDRVLPAVDHAALTGAALDACVHRAGSATPLLPSAADRYFRLDLVSVSTPMTIEGGFAVALVTSGAVDLLGDRYVSGDVLLLDAVDAQLTLASADAATAEVVVARPPRP